MYQLINKDAVFQFLGEDPDFIKPILEIVLNVNLNELKQLDALYEAEEYEEVKIKCHKAKSAMGYVGSSHTKKILQTIELDVINTYPELKDDLKKDVDLLEVELKHFLEHL
ncbi:hypothetical protein GCM10028791_31470 [Echinicola sediminis]